MKIHSASDLHGYRPPFPGGDVLILIGPIVMCHTIDQWVQAAHWIESLDYTHKILVAGPIDVFLYDQRDWLLEKMPSVTYLQNTGCEIDGFKFWGSPFQLKSDYFGMPIDSIREVWAQLPHDTDVLITHTPACRLDNDSTDDYTVFIGDYLLQQAINSVKPRLHVFGGAVGDRGVSVYETWPNGLKTTYANVCVTDQFNNVENDHYFEIEVGNAVKVRKKPENDIEKHQRDEESRLFSETVGGSSDE